jgi:DNA invertase Pin-like site-specific DNA recombinase
MKIGYARISTKEQNIDSQIIELKKEGCEDIYREQISGSSKDRPILKKLLEFIREGDILVVWRLDRLGRTLRGLIDLIQELKEKGVEFVSIQENINTSTASGRLFFHINGAFAEMERELISERTKAGLEAARARGVRGGRKFKLSPEKIKDMKEMYKSKDVAVADICDLFKISRPTLYNYLNTY